MHDLTMMMMMNWSLQGATEVQQAHTELTVQRSLIRCEEKNATAAFVSASLCRGNVNWPDSCLDNYQKIMFAARFTL